MCFGGGKKDREAKKKTQEGDEVMLTLRWSINLPLIMSSPLLSPPSLLFHAPVPFFAPTSHLPLLMSGS